MAPLALVAFTVMLLEQVSTMGTLLWRTVTVKLQLVNVPHESVAVQLTVVVPSRKLLPLGGLQTREGGGLQPPLAELEKKTVAPLGLVADTVILEEQFNTNGGFVVAGYIVIPALATLFAELVSPGLQLINTA